MPEQGSVFSFSLPLYGLGVATNPLVLVATGDERTRREVRRVAERHGFTTHEVGDGVSWCGWCERVCCESECGLVRG